MNNKGTGELNLLRGQANNKGTGELNILSKKLLLPTPHNKFLIVRLFALGLREGDIISDYV